MAKLYILSGARNGRVFELHEDRVTVGRAPDNMICLPDELVSIYHATFIREGNSYRLRDLNSTNSTRVNGEKITESKLNDFDQVKFGDVQARFTAEVQVNPEVLPPVALPVPEPGRKVSALQWVALGVGIGMVLMLVAMVFIGGRLLEHRRELPPPPAKWLAETPAVRLAVVAPPTNNIPVAAATPVEVMPDMSEMSPKPMEETPSETNALSPTVATITPPSTEKPALPPPEQPKPVPPIVPRITNQLSKVIAPVVSGPVIVKPNPYDGQGLLTGQTPVDQVVFGRLQRLGIQPASVCSDAVFVRRVYFDVIGTLPTAEEVRAFLEDRNPNKRGALIDKLLERDEFAEYWAMKWCDLLRVKAEFPINLWPNAVQTYHQWIRTSLKENRRYDRFARDLLTSSGSNFRDPPVNFYRAVQGKDPQSLAQTVALTFMGARAENWPKERLAGMTAFFAQVGFKSTSEWKEEIVFYDSSKATNATTTATFPDGASVELPVGKDPRVIFANWLITPSNPWFTRNIVNRIWSWLLGRGVIHEPDDIRPDNPPVIPEVLTLLERELIANKYDLKSVYRLILKSRAYQLSAVSRSNDPRAEEYFAFYPVRRLEAEVMIDAINQITGTTEKYSSPIPEPFTFIPENERSIALADGSISSPFLELFGRSSRATGMEAERNNRPTAAQQLHLLNSSHIQRKIEQSAKLKALLQSAKGKPRGVVDALYLTILSRYPTDEEVRIVTAYSKTAELSQRAGLDLAWALINSTEFQHRH